MLYTGAFMCITYISIIRKQSQNYSHAHMCMHKREHRQEHYSRKKEMFL